MKFISIKEAKTQKLVPLTEWLFDNAQERKVLKRFYDQVMVNEGRIAAYVIDNLGSRIAVYVNDIVDKFDFHKGIKK